MRLGTRGSALALAQAGLVASLLGDDVELVEVATSGDRDAARGDKGRWVGELEQALLDDRIDLAVHSAKDVPALLADGCALVGVPERADARDVIVGAASIAELAPGSRVGTSSPRRRAQLLATREDLEVVEVRGNVDTRLRKLASGDCDALVLAAAGLARLGRLEEAGGFADPAAMVPAAGQGTLALEGRAGDAAAATRAAAVTEPVAHACLRAERAVVTLLDATCHTPVGVHAVHDPGGALHLTAWVGLPDGSTWIRDTQTGRVEVPEALGALVAGRMDKAGARELLAQAEAMSA